MSETNPSLGRRSSSRVRKKAALLQDENFVQIGHISKNKETVDSNSSILFSRHGRAFIPIEKRICMLYGKERPLDAPKDVCAECLKSSEADSSEVVLLCDGPDCHREYHLSCANLTRMPGENDPFFCFDCHPIGGRTEALLKYLDQHNDDRDVPEEEDSWSQIGVWKHLIEQDLRRTSSSSPKSLKKKTISSPEAPPIPRSELHDPCPWHTGRKNSVDDNFLIGCPARLYVPEINDYIVGRITDHRQNNGVAEHYVRFPAGSLEMKVPVSAWIVLEEHSLLVNTGAVIVTSEATYPSPNTAGRGKKRSHAQADLTPANDKNQSPSTRPTLYKLASAWVRTSRELLSVKNVEFLPIAFYDSGESPWSCLALKSHLSRTVMIRDIGTTNKFRFVEAAHLKDFDLLEHETCVDPIAFELAKCERMEKQRVREWYNMRSCVPETKRGTLKRDVDELPPLDVRPAIRPVFLTRGKYVDACPAVRTGLDRVYIAERLRRLGVPADVSTASGVKCHSSKPFHFSTSTAKF